MEVDVDVDVEVDVDVDVEVEVEVEVDDDVVAAVVLVVDEDVVVVLVAVHVVPRVKLDASGHPDEQAAPAGQHRRVLGVEPQGVVPEGQPQNEVARSTHAMPLSQHDRPHGVVPAGQQHAVAESLQAWPFAQHPVPHVCAPAGQVSALPRNGRSRAPPVIAAIEAPSTFSAPRLEEEADIARVSSSKPSVMIAPLPGLTVSAERAHSAP